MSLVDEMLAEVGDTSVLFTRFMDLSKCIEYKNKELIPCIVEGDEDYSFYEPKIRSLLNKSSEKIISGGIDKAIEFLGAINESNYYSNSIFIIFLDSDFNLDSEKEGDHDNRVFYLDKYSIENLYITDNFYDNILESLTKLERKRNKTDGTLDRSSDYFIVRKYILDERNEMMSLIEDYMVCLRAIMISQSEIEFKPLKNIISKLRSGGTLINSDNTLNEFLFMDVFQIDSSSQEKIHITQSKILESKLYFESNSALDSYRGKELIYISNKVLSSVKSNFCGKQSILSERLKFPKQVKEEDFISDFSAYTEEPEGLREFINELKANYI